MDIGNIGGYVPQTPLQQQHEPVSQQEKSIDHLQAADTVPSERVSTAAVPQPEAVPPQQNSLREGRLIDVYA